MDLAFVDADCTLGIGREVGKLPRGRFLAPKPPGDEGVQPNDSFELLLQKALREDEAALGLMALYEQIAPRWRGRLLREIDRVLKRETHPPKGIWLRLLASESDRRLARWIAHHLLRFSPLGAERKAFVARDEALGYRRWSMWIADDSGRREGWCFWEPLAPAEGAPAIERVDYLREAPERAPDTPQEGQGLEWESALAELLPLLWRSLSSGRWSKNEEQVLLRFVDCC